ncbi:MAG TPA: response regulator transcription factor [Ktedonobacteraceae bacterium]|nr:response regulator transcription factor [Ktedonobacteraceae bacterium]
MHLFYLSQQEQVLHFILRQDAYTADSFQILMHELMSLFHGGEQAEHSQENSENDANITADLLSSRELEVLQCIAEGLSNREIAQHCVITEGTVKRHINNIYSKLGVKSRTQALMQAKLLGFLLA